MIWFQFDWVVHRVEGRDSDVHGVSVTESDVSSRLRVVIELIVQFVFHVLMRIEIPGLFKHIDRKN